MTAILLPTIYLAVLAAVVLIGSLRRKKGIDR